MDSASGASIPKVRPIPRISATKFVKFGLLAARGILVFFRFSEYNSPDPVPGALVTWVALNAKVKR